ncbi:hypothetical protein FVEN_g6498 [Fusarium venenatum]|nr:hypothetical protein FVEN_g6498 [Fusarium venenatum]
MNSKKVPENGPNISAQNHASGCQYLGPGDGDQNVVSSDGVQLNDRSDRRQYNNTFALHCGQGIPPAWNLAEIFKEGHRPPEPTATRVIEWLTRQDNYSPLDFNYQHLDIISQATPKTGEWILESPELKQWRDSSGLTHRRIGMHGILGSGKTVLVSRIVAALKSEIGRRSDFVCIYFYFHEGDDRSPPVGRIWSTLLLQLLQHSPNISEELKNKFSNSVRVSASIHQTEYLGLFIAQASMFDTVYLIIDALDSCTNSKDERTRHLLQEGLRKLPGNVRVLITVRRDSLFDDLGISQKIEVKPCEQDVKTYIEYEINKDNELLQILSNRDHQENVVSRVTNLTLESGMFLLANLHLNNLRNRGTVTDIKAALQQLPTTSDGSFEISVRKILRTSSPFQIDLARHVFTWVVYAKTGLTISQIRDSFSIQTRNGKQYQDSRPPENAILSACAGLIVEDQETKTLRLVHESVKDHLQKNKLFLENPNLNIAKSCLTSLLMGDSEQLRKPLLEYSATHWCSHLSKPFDTDIGKLVRKFLLDNSSLERAFKMITEFPSETCYGMTGLHAAVWFNRSSWIKHLIESGADINSSCSNGQTALHWAAVHGRYEVLYYLVKHHAETNITDANGETALHKLLLGPTTDGLCAARSLVRRGASLDIKSNKGLTPLSSAIRYGPTSIALLLVDSQENVDVELAEGWTSLREVFFHAHEMSRELALTRRNQTSDDGWCALRDAVRTHVSCLIDLLLEKGVDLNRPTKDGWLPVMHLVKNGNPELLQRLLERHPNPADANQREKDDGGSALYWALCYRKYHETELLLSHGADVNEKGPDGSTPLIQAISNKKEALVWLFIRNGANVNGQDDRGWSPLHHAVEAQSKDIAWLLITNKANAKLGQHDNPSPLLMALKSSQYAIAWLLCQNGADIDEVDEKNMTLLHRACDGGRVNEVEFLLSNGANLGVKDTAGFTALHYAVLSDQEKVLNAVLSRRSVEDMIDEPDTRGNSALLIATMRGNVSMIQNLTNRGASLQYTDSNALTALHHVASLGLNVALEYLVARSMAINQRDSRGYTVVHHAVCSSNTNADTISLLAEGGANLEACDDQGLTPLMWAVHLGKVSHTRELLIQGVDRYAGLDTLGWSVIDLIHSNECQGRDHDVVRTLLLEPNSSIHMDDYIY